MESLFVARRDSESAFELIDKFTALDGKELDTNYKDFASSCCFISS